MPKLQRSAQLGWFITVPLAAVAVWFTVVAAPLHRPLLSPLPVTLLYVALFSVAEATNLRIEVRRHGIWMAVTEVPLILGLFYLSPLTLVLVRVLATAVVHGRGISPVKLAFNMANVAAATSLAALMVASYGSRPGLPPRMWIVLVAAVVVGMIVTVAAVMGVISLVQGRISPSDLARTAVPSIIVGSINAVTGLVVLLVVKYSPWATVLLVGLAVAVVFIYRAYAQFLRQNKSLTEIYEVTRALAENPVDAGVADVLLGRVRELLHAEYATLWLPAHGRFPETLLSARPDDLGLLDISATPPTVRAHAMRTGKTVVVTPKTGDPDLRGVMRAAGVKDAIVVPLKSGGVVIGSLEVTGRMGDNANAYFTLDDVRLLETLAAHASVSVENARLVDRLRFDAEHDSLTGLPNRRRMLNALDEALKVRAPDEVVVIMIFDVGGLRDVNDSLGHASGDKLLVEFARRLRGVSPPAALVGRVGGDGFAVTLRMESADAAVDLAEELLDALRHPMEMGSLSLDIDAAVGIAVYPEHGSDSSALVQRADVATHVAKTQPSSIQLFDPSLESRSVRRLGLASDLRRAIDNGSLEIYFQPKLSLRSRELVGVECLARWDHPVHGLVAPEDFIAVAEHTGQMGRLTEFVMREGLLRARGWIDAGRPLPVAVNLSPRTILDQGLSGRIADLLAEYAVPSEMFTLEITEAGVLGEADRPLPMLRRLDDLGIRLSIDDFGTGYSSLSYLSRFPIDEVKIDRSFVQGMATDSGDLAIVRAIVDLARHFGLRAVAEGVESELTLSLLVDMGCEIGQGFLFSRPLPYDRLEAWIAARTEESAPSGDVRRLRAVP